MRQEVCYCSTGLDFKICLRARKVTRPFEKRSPGERERKRAGHDGKGKDRRKAPFPIVRPPLRPPPAPSIFRLYGTCLHISHNDYSIKVHCQARCARRVLLLLLIGTFSIHDGDGSENVTFKRNWRFFQLCCVYSNGTIAR